MEIRIIADLNTHFIRAPIHCTGKQTITQNYGYSSRGLRFIAEINGT